MIHSVRFTAVLDTNIIYPIEIRDVLFWFAHYELFTPKWSNHIFEEWENEDALAAHFTAPSFFKMSEHLSEHGLLGASAKKYLVSKEAGIYNAEGSANAYFD